MPLLGCCPGCDYCLPQWLPSWLPSWLGCELGEQLFRSHLGPSVDGSAGPAGVAVERQRDRECTKLTTRTSFVGIVPWVSQLCFCPQFPYLSETAQAHLRGNFLSASKAHRGCHFQAGHAVLGWRSEPLLKDAAQHIPSRTGHSSWRWQLLRGTRSMCPGCMHHEPWLFPHWLGGLLEQSNMA